MLIAHHGWQLPCGTGQILREGKFINKSLWSNFVRAPWVKYEGETRRGGAMWEQRQWACPGRASLDRRLRDLNVGSGALSNPSRAQQHLRNLESIDLKK